MGHIRGNSAKGPSLKSGSTSIPVIGIAGTAKNTGKTTTMNALLMAARKHERVAGVTSIGYDGEAIDNVTALPKPRVILPQGSIATTSLACVPPRGWSVLATTGCRNALGEVVIVRCEETGKLVLAGPNKRSDLLRVVRDMTDLAPGIIFIDGALNRIAPLAAAQSVVLATGGARSTDIPFLCREMQGAEQVFLSGTSQVFPTPDVPLPPPQRGQDIEYLLASCIDQDNRLRVPWFIDERTLRELAAELGPEGAQRSVAVREVVFRDPFTLLLAGEMEGIGRLVRTIRDAGVTVSYEHPVRLRAVTVNPFYPAFSHSAYTASHIDAAALRENMRRTIHVPVVDVMGEGAEELWTAVIGRLDR
jgi:hypothetical protein